MCHINNLEPIGGPELFRAGVIYFNAGRYFEAHEAWEDLWRSVESGSVLRNFYHGLIHAAVGLHHQSRGNLIGARSQISKSIEKLRQAPEEVHGIQVSQLIAELAAILDGLKA